MSDAAGEIREAIAAAGGAVPFSEFQRLALYGSGGFYTGSVGGRAGRRGGAFLTSPEVGPLFGAVLARYLDAEWLALGRPDPFTVVDAGAGPGTLARAILAAQPSCRAAMRYVGRRGVGCPTGADTLSTSSHVTSSRMAPSTA